MISYDVTREDWDAKPAKPGLVPIPNLAWYEGVEFHHGGDEADTRDGSNYGAVQSAMMSGKYNDIWYNVGLTDDGRIWELRGWEWKSGNEGLLTVNVAGNYVTGSAPNLKVRQGMRNIREAVRDGGGGTRVAYHNDRDQTACPGKVKDAKLMNLRPPTDDTSWSEVIPALGHFKAGRYPSWTVSADGSVISNYGAPKVHSLADYGISHLDAPVVEAFYDFTIPAVVMFAADGGTFVLEVSGGSA